MCTIFCHAEFAFSYCTELQNEVSLLSKIRHQNIIKLLGYCIHGESRFLVYEFMESDSLETQLHGTFFIDIESKKREKYPILRI